MYRTTITLEDRIAEAGKDLAKLRGFQHSFSAYLAWLIDRDDSDGVAPKAPKDEAAYKRRLARQYKHHPKEDQTFALLTGKTAPPPSEATPSKKKPAKSKRAHLTDQAWVSLGIYGTIPAGWPADGAVRKPKRTVRVPRGKYPSDAFGLDVTGESMNAAKGKLGPILPGETVVLAPFECADKAAGKIVAALIDRRTTLKRLVCPAGKPCYLQPESSEPEFAGKMHPLEEVTVQGVVIGKL